MVDNNDCEAGMKLSRVGMIPLEKNYYEWR